MNEIEKQILESVQFLLSIQKVDSEMYLDKLAVLMAKNHVLLNPICQTSIADKTKDALSQSNAEGGK